MDRFDRFYDLSETARVRFLGFATENARYDFGIVFTHRFDGKPLVICLQTGQSTLLSSDDAINPGTLKRIFKLDCEQEAEELSHFFLEHLPSVFAAERQY